MTQLLIARHGNTFAPSDIVTRLGITDLPLVESGLRQGLLLGEYLKQQHLLPDVIFTSQLKRTIQTAEQAQKAMNTSLPLQALTIFNEIDYGPDENQPETKVIARLGKDALLAWEQSAKVPSGWKVNPSLIIQAWLDFSNTILKQYQGKTILVITSNGIARFAPWLTGDFDAFASQQSIKIATGAICRFIKTPESSVWNCLEWNTKPVR